MGDWSDATDDGEAIWDTHEIILADEVLSSFPLFLGVPDLSPLQ